MYGTGSTSNGYLPVDPTTGLPFYDHSDHTGRRRQLTTIS